MRCVVPIILLGAMAAAALAAGQTRAPRLTCEAPVYDYGALDNSADVEHTFVLTNAGTAAAVIAQVRSGCGCTRTEISTNSIPPGGSAILTARLSLRGIVGGKEATVFVQSNDPTMPVLQLQLTGTATTEMEIVPRQVTFESRNGAPPPDVTVSIVNRTSELMHILKWETPGAAFSVRVETNEPGRTYTVKVGLAAQAAGSSATGTVCLVTDHPRNPRIEIPVGTAWKADVVVLPKELTFAVAADAQAPARYVILRSTQDTAFRVTGVEPPLATIPVTVQSRDRSWTRIRTGPFQAPPSLTDAVLRVHTDVKGLETIPIPMHVVRDAPAASPPPTP